MESKSNELEESQELHKSIEYRDIKLESSQELQQAQQPQQAQQAQQPIDIIEFTDYRNKDENNTIISDSKTVSNTVSKTEVNDDGGIIYDIIRFIDDIYVYGRTEIENNLFNLSSNDDFNIVYPNIYVGNYSTSTNYELLKGLGITHIISVIPKINPPFLNKFKYLFIQAYDDEYQDMKQHFTTANEFIKHCLIQGGKVLIHCMVGRSRSITIFIAFLIYIIQGNVNQYVFRLEDDRIPTEETTSDTPAALDATNIIEYRKFSEKKSMQYKTNHKTQHKRNASYSDIEKITKVEQERPSLGKKEENFIIYKKNKMIADIDELIDNYKALQKDLDNFKKQIQIDNEESEELTDNIKTQFRTKILIQILNYVKSHREIASPNPHFINQLGDLLF